VARYAIGNGKGYIAKDSLGRFTITTNLAIAEIYCRDKAENVYKSSISKSYKARGYKVVKLDDDAPDSVRQITTKELRKNTEKVLDVGNIQKWLDKIADLNGLAADALHRKAELIEQLSKVDRELSDIAHYIEFNNLNAAQGYKAYKMEHERRIIRRSIKNEIQVLEIILGKKISETVTDEINNAVTGMDQRSYEPRELSELFDF
jgi:hypothetical protein